MVINTLKYNYYVIHKLIDNDLFETFLCYETGTVSERHTQNRYRVCRLKNKELTYRLIPVFTELQRHSEFTDYFDCFSKDGFLYLVFLHRDYPPLVNKLGQERCELKERLEIGKRLLERILMLNIPDYILYDVLSEENVLISPSLEIFFHYNLTNLFLFDSLSITEVKQRLVTIYQHLFEYELMLEASVDIEDFVTELQERDYNNYFEIYKRFEELYEKLSSGDLIQKIKPNTFLFRLWDRIKSWAKYLKPVIAVIILFLIAGYLLYTMMHKKVDEAAVFNFEQIESVTIESDASNK